MTELTASKTSIHIRCSRTFKDRVEAHAEREGKCVSDALIDIIAEALKTDEKMERFIAITDEQARRDDYESLIQLTHNGEQVP